MQLLKQFTKQEKLLRQNCMFCSAFLVFIYVYLRDLCGNKIIRQECCNNQICSLLQFCFSLLWQNSLDSMRAQ